MQLPRLCLVVVGMWMCAACGASDESDADGPYDLLLPAHFDAMELPRDTSPEDNPLTRKGVALGRRLFYDERLSDDDSMACATCHLQEDAFSDENRFSEGIHGDLGDRQAPALVNPGWSTSFFWDGRRATLEEQALDPVENEIEMATTWEEVVPKLQADPGLPGEFAAVFGDEQVTKERVAKAISQFERTLASFDSPYDRFVYGGDQEALNEAELRGMFLFIHTPGVCEKCHPPPLFTNNEFMNNGLETDPKDPGRAKISEDPADRGKHKTPTLRNIAQSGPYMHDGRFETLRQVVEHYNTGVEEDAPNLAPELGPAALDSMGFTEDNLDDLVAFLGALSEDAFLNDPKLGDPDDE